MVSQKWSVLSLLPAQVPAGVTSSGNPPFPEWTGEGESPVPGTPGPQPSPITAPSTLHCESRSLVCLPHQTTGASEAETTSALYSTASQLPAEYGACGTNQKKQTKIFVDETNCLFTEGAVEGGDRGQTKRRLKGEAKKAGRGSTGHVCTSARVPRGGVGTRADAVAMAEAVNRSRASCTPCCVQMSPVYTPGSPGH